MSVGIQSGGQAGEGGPCPSLLNFGGAHMGRPQVSPLPFEILSG